MSKLEMPDLCWFNVKEEIQKLREIEVLEWICHFRLTHPSWEGPEDLSFTDTLRNEFARGAPVSLKCSVIAFLCRPDLTVGTIVIQLENLDAVALIGFWGGRGQWWHSKAKSKVSWFP